MGRSSGIAAAFEPGNERIVAEFTFWPLGSLLSFSELHDPRLAPIHHWAKYDYKFNGVVEINLSVNPVATCYPGDFRSAQAVLRDAATRSDPLTLSEEQRRGARDLMSSAVARSGVGPGGWVWAGKEPLA
jgi:hypothetical protein